MHLNTYIKYEQTRYEIYWTSGAAQHVLENYAKPTHGVDHTTISRILRRARYILPLEADARPYLHVCLTRFQDTIFETYVFLVPALPTWPARCVVVTCYKSNKAKFRTLFGSLPSVA